mgnify:CR=1 FL=1
MNALEQKIEFYSRDIDNPFSVNGFKGTWAISDHNLIPDVLHEYLMLYFRESRLTRVSLDKINACLNEVWEGPGSLAQVFAQTVEMRKTGRDITFSSVRTKGAVIDEDPVDTPISNFGIEDPVELDSDD